jgi:UDP-N-acetylglucosamine 2-epimerase (non-hydrolysing)
VKVLSVVGARPQFVKLAPVSRALIEAGHQHVIVHTGQHYDVDMSDVFFSDLRIPSPDVHLGVGSGGHGVQTGSMLGAMDAVLEEHNPDWVLVYGDTNSTIAGALAAVKLHLPVAHLEAGLRSFNRRMPEEHNRVLTDHAADLLLAPTQTAMDHLATEGLAARSVLVGDVMTDILFTVRDTVRDRVLPLPDGLRDTGYLLATIHRADNTDDPARLRAIVEGLAALPFPVLLLTHPRLVAKADALGVDLAVGAIHPVRPFAYPDMVGAVSHSRGVVTDSGGLQKEAFLLRVPCTTLRTETEWPETLVGGWNALCPDPAQLTELVSRAYPEPTDSAPYGDGHAAAHVVRTLVQHLT